MSAPRCVGVVLMTYGSPRTLDDVPAYLANVRGGRPADDDLVAEFRRRYRLIGGSPLIEITRAQANALERVLQIAARPGWSYLVEIGMRFSEPSVAAAVAALAGRGVDTMVGIIMSPQYSPIIMSGYVRAIEEAAAAQAAPIPVLVAGSWHRQPAFLQALCQRLREALDEAASSGSPFPYVLLTAHSMPKRVVEGEPGYIAQLHETASLVAELAGLSDDRWQFCYQSAGHTPEEWLKPDFADVMPLLAQAGESSVLIAPVQFLADHLEILYDIEIGAREQAERHGLRFARTASLNTSPLFIDALAAVVEEQLASAP